MGKRMAVGIVALLALAGCGMRNAPTQQQTDDEVGEVHITLKDGRRITCLVYDGGYDGGMSCDWTAR